ncbi:MAG TPA: hypothetical protein VKF62_05725 [Planctomycetota bacterium]|nr:hypothetical protein [Planctomycetota bacterium]
MAEGVEVFPEKGWAFARFPGRLVPAQSSVRKQTGGFPRVRRFSRRPGPGHAPAAEAAFCRTAG